jgi:RNase adaptor protein for sRNA GlmZ degradation
MVDISVEEYIKRGFDSLSVNFGCTGGQHRSVYAADALAKHLHSKYKVKVELYHREQEAKGWKNPLRTEEQMNKEQTNEEVKEKQ